MKKKKQSQSLLVVGKVFNIISGGASILSYIGMPAVVIWAYICKRPWLLILLLIPVLLLLTIKKCKEKHVDIIKWLFDIFACNMQYAFDEWTAQYEYHSESDMSFRTSYTVRALQAGVDHINVRFNWSGTTKDRLLCPEPICDDGYNSRELIMYRKEYGYAHHQLFSRCIINKGDDPIKLGMKIENMHDEAKTATPHLQTSISVVTKKLKMIVILPAYIYPQSIRCLEYLHSTDSFHWHDLSGDYTLERHGKEWHIVWCVNKPIFGGRYIMTWEPEIVTAPVVLEQQTELPS